MQNPEHNKATKPETQTELELEEDDIPTSGVSKGKNAEVKVVRQPWPKTLPERMVAVQSALHRHSRPAKADEIAAYYTRAVKADVAELLETLVAVGNVRQIEDGRFAVYR